MNILSYYLVYGILLILLVPGSLIGFGYWWNKKWRMRQTIRQVPTDSFSNIFRKWRMLSFKEDPQIFFEDKATRTTKKYLSRRFFYVVLLILTGLLFLIVPFFSPLPIFFLPLIIFGFSSVLRYRMISGIRFGILMRMYEVAASEFRYPKGGELVPWSYVQIREWEDLTTPGQTVVVYPASFRADDIMRRESFESHFNGTVTDDNTWIYTWKPAQSAVLAEPVSHLPEMAAYPGSARYPWHTFPIGIGADGVVSYSVNKNETGIYYPHVLIAGTTGSGKSVIQRNIIFHCIQHNDMWRFLGVDVKRVELTPFNKYKKTVLGIGANLEDGVEICRYAKDVMMKRYEEMESLGINHFLDMKDEHGKPPYAILLMIDEAFMFMSPEGNRSDEGKARDDLHAEASTLIGDIARLGRAAGIHLVLATQRPDATVIKGELKANLDVRIAAGRLDSTPSSMVLDSGAATLLPGAIKGRGVIRFGGAIEQFQGFYAEADWIDEWLKKHPDREPSLFGRGSKNKENDKGRLEVAEPKTIELFDDSFEELDEGNAIVVDADGNPTVPTLFEVKTPTQIIDGLDEHEVPAPKTFDLNPTVDLLPPPSFDDEDDEYELTEVDDFDSEDIEDYIEDAAELQEADVDISAAFAPISSTSEISEEESDTPDEESEEAIAIEEAIVDLEPVNAEIEAEKPKVSSPLIEALMNPKAAPTAIEPKVEVAEPIAPKQTSSSIPKRPTLPIKKTDANS